MLKDMVHVNSFSESSTGKKNVKKSEMFTDTPVKECVTAEIKAVSA